MQKYVKVFTFVVFLMDNVTKEIHYSNSSVRLIYGGKQNVNFTPAQFRLTCLLLTLLYTFVQYSVYKYSFILLSLYKYSFMVP